MRTRLILGITLSAAFAGLGLIVVQPTGAAAGAASGQAVSSRHPSPSPTGSTLPAGYAALVPVPVSATPTPGVHFAVTSATSISTDSVPVGDYLAGLLRRSTGYPVPVASAGTGGDISLLLSGAPADVGAEGYTLDVTGTGVTIRAQQPAGLFEGVQTLRQLLPSSVDSGTVQPGPWTVPGGHVTDHPRFAYRGAMLDVARHFFTVAQVERYVDEITAYKVNYLHLHLSDDQGWRIAITGWPNLTDYGGGTEVGGGPGGFFTQADYASIVDYAQQRFVTVIPEIDVPGHTNAALASYAALNCDGVAPPRYTGTDVGFSSLCTGKDITYQFLADVIGQLAALTPGPYLHIGGDEAQSTKAADYAAFITRVQQLVTAQGKTMVGWHDIVSAATPSAWAEFWDTTTSNSAVAAAAQRGTRLVMAPANHAYLDMKYTRKTKLGQNWAGYTEVDKAYGWDPGAYLSGVPASAVAGVEAPLWTETLVTSADLEYMAFPRLPAIAELGWSPESTHSWPGFQARLATQGPRWKAAGLAYYHSTEIPWPAGS